MHTSHYDIIHYTTVYTAVRILYVYNTYVQFVCTLHCANIAWCIHAKKYFRTRVYTNIHEHIPLHTYIVIVIVIVIWWSPFITSRNLDEVFNYNEMTLMSLRSRTHVKASVVLTRADHLCIHNYII